MYIRKNVGEIVKLGTIPALIASLCCLSPILLVSLGVISISVASDLADVLYGEYKWLFRGAGLVALAVFVISYIRRKKNICTLSEARRRKNEIINIIALTLVIGSLLYILFLYGIIELIGKVLNIW